MLNVLLAAVFGLLAGFLYETWTWNSDQERAAWEAPAGSSGEVRTRAPVP
jgi:hypothetical protein